MKKFVKIIIILMIFLVCSMSISKVYATQSTKWSKNGIEWWEPEKNIDVGQDEFEKKANIVTTAIRNVGIVVAILALMIIGFREMTASVEEKSNLKNALPGYLLGILLVITVSVLPSIIYNLAKNFK